MIELGLVGVADSRHQLYLDPVERRRAAVRPVGFSETDAVARGQFAERTRLTGYPDHRELLDAVAPSLLAVAVGSGTVEVIRDGLTAGADLVVAHPLCASIDELDELTDLAAETGHRVTPLYTYRSHATSRLAKELIDDGRLGRVDLMALVVAGSVETELVRRA